MEQCCVCTNVIDKNESTVSCKLCTSVCHETCMGLRCGNRVNGKRLIDTTEFKTVVEEMCDVLSTSAFMFISTSDTCCVCESDIGNEISAICDCCNSQFHVSCMQLPCQSKLSDARLIWIRSMC